MQLPLDALKSLILKTGLVSEKDFDSAVQESQRTDKEVIDILVSRNLITRDYYAETLAQYFKVPRVKLIGEKIPSEILHLIPEEIARTRNAVVFAKEDNTIKVALLDPVNLDTLEFLGKYTGYFIKPYLALEEDLNSVFAQYGQVVSSDFQKTIQESIQASLKLKGVEAEKAATEFPIVSLTDNLISYAASLRSTDIHMEPLADEVLIRFRIDGVLREIIRLAKEIHPALVARIKILSNLQIDEHSKPQDGRIKYKYADTIFDIRVAIMPTMYGEKVEMRLLTSSTKPMSFQELGMLEDTIKIVENNITKSNGMILITGPTGSGKTTTMYAMLNKLNRPEVNIVTIEDPIEYELKYVNQTQVNPKAGIDFANALRAFLRQDPNIIMVGEIRDNETAEIAVHAALTGHLVLSTLHTNDAPTTVPRLMDMGVPPFLIASTLNLVIAQRLVRKVCPECIESYEPPQSIYQTIDDQLKIIKGEFAKPFRPKLLYHGKGCPSCNFTGYRGRLAIYESFDVDESVRDYIQRKDFSLDGLKKIAFSKGSKTMFEDGLQKAEIGQTTIEEVLRVIKE
ncbi:MAG: type II/IV secretion system protein [Parcubacteria group bacterium]|nr:type II/IV secretion system protein [Parcubacteria group bacterium]